MIHKPCRLLRDLQGAADLPRANAVLAIGDKPHSREPLIQAERRVLKDSPRLDGELAALVALVALPAVVLLLKGYIVTAATRTGDAIRPATGNNVFTAINRIREVNDCVLKGCRLHESSMTLFDGVVKYILAPMRFPEKPGFLPRPAISSHL